MTDIQEPLVGLEIVPAALPAAVPYAEADPVAYSAAVGGDGLEWLAGLLPAPRPLPCPRCRQPMRLGPVPLLWECPGCDNRQEVPS